jgi:hypothetical protein
MTEEKKIYLGICMAGAITAGSYTAGVMDYLFETLENWQFCKDENIRAREAGKRIDDWPYPSVPMYDVIIQIISGASAGGMCAAITTSMLAEGVKANDFAYKNSKLYKAWIELADGDERDSTIKKLLDTSDIKVADGLESLLNSKVLDNLCDKVITVVEEPKFPKYVSEDLDILTTITNLRGKPYHIKFKSDGKDKEHTMILHRDFMHFRMGEEANPRSVKTDFLPLDFRVPNHVEMLKATALATGAFPIGLSARGLSRSEQYYNSKTSNIVGDEKATLSPIPDRDYHSLNIDGGALNNEPFGETERILKSKLKQECANNTNKTKYSIIMIDPFPSSKEDLEDINKLDNDGMGKADYDKRITKVAKRIIATLRAQNLFKTDDIRDSFDNNIFLKFIMYPSHPICSASLEAFGGFLYRDFREYDYQLGRRNAQKFLRCHFKIPFNSPVNKEYDEIHEEWPADAIAKLKLRENDNEYLPIIPMVSILGEKLEDVEDGKIPHHLQVNLDEAPPKIGLSKIKSLNKPIANRILAIATAFKDLKAEVSNEYKEAEKLLKKAWHKRTLNYIGKPLTVLGISLGGLYLKYRGQYQLSHGLLKYILADLLKKDLVDKNK